MTSLSFTLLLLLQQLGLSWGYSSGLVESACSSMTPGHGPVSQASGGPFEMEVSETEIDSGASVLLTLRRKSASDPEFKGFLIQAKDVADDSLVGEFTDTG